MNKSKGIEVTIRHIKIIHITQDKTKYVHLMKVGQNGLKMLNKKEEQVVLQHPII